jgi:GMP synthase (glutamine-hydrolysing)
MKPLLIIMPGTKLDTLNEIEGDFHDWIVAGMQWRGEVIVCRVHDNDVLPSIESVSGVVITGSGAMVTDHEPWMEISAEWLRYAANRIPVLGICFGHQLLAYALGGDVAVNPRGVEVGRVEVKINKKARDDMLFHDLPKQIQANVSHLQSVTRLPEGAQLLASSELERHQAFRVGERVWGIQFHPEFSAAITACYIDFYREQLQQQGRQVEALQSGLGETAEASAILQRFAQIIESGK